MKRLKKALVGALIGTTALCSVIAFSANTCSLEDVHVHDWNSDFTVDKVATCTEDGSKSIHCNSCNETKDVTPIPAAHSWGTEYTVDLDPACTTAGSKSIHCTVDGCDGKNDVTAIPATGHVWATEYTVDTPATCMVDGSKSKHCTVDGCDGKDDVTVITASGQHVWAEEYTVDLEPTCTDDGSKSIHCTVDGCDGKNDITPIPANGHSWDTEYTVDLEPTCTDPGSKSKHCTVDGCDGKDDITSIPATGHVQVTSHPATQSTCSVNGYEAYWYCEDCSTYFSDAACTTSIDAPVDLPLADHTYDWLVSQQNYKAATCTEDGHAAYYSCSVCEAKFSGVTGNSLSGPISDEDWAANYVIPATHKSITTRTVKDPTCTLDGYTTLHYYCNTCRSSAWDNAFTQIMTADEVTSVTVAKLGHNYSEEWTVDKEATCSAKGSKSHHCTRCTSKTGTTAIDMLPHDWDESEYVVDVAVTCQTAGSKSYHCSVCGAKNADSEVEIPVDANAHAWSARYFDITPATCMAAGSHAKYCMLCGVQQTPEVAPIDSNAHNYSTEWTVDVEADCTTAGSKSRHCTVAGCDAHGYVTEIPALGHNYQWQFEGLNGTQPCVNGCGFTAGDGYTLPAEAAGKTINNVVEVNAASGHFNVSTGANFVAVADVNSGKAVIHYLDFSPNKSGTYLFTFEYFTEIPTSGTALVVCNQLLKGSVNVTSKATIVRSPNSSRGTAVSAQIDVLVGETLTLYLVDYPAVAPNYIMTVSSNTAADIKTVAYGNNTVEVTVSNDLTGVDSYTFTPTETKRYAMTVPEGLSVAMNNNNFIQSGTYAEFTATAGKDITFSFSHSEVDEYTVTIGELVPRILELNTTVTPSLQGHTLVGYQVADGVTPGRYTLTLTGSFLVAKASAYGYLWLQVNGSGDYADMTNDNALYIHSGATTDKEGYELSCSGSTWTVTLELTAGDVIYLTLDTAYDEAKTVEGAGNVLNIKLTAVA